MIGDRWPSFVCFLYIGTYTLDNRLIKCNLHNQKCFGVLRDTTGPLWGRVHSPRSSRAFRAFRFRNAFKTRLKRFISGQLRVSGNYGCVGGCERKPGNVVPRITYDLATHVARIWETACVQDGGADSGYCCNWERQTQGPCSADTTSRQCLLHSVDSLWLTQLGHEGGSS